MSDQLAVFLHGRHAGDLSRPSGSLQFTYSPEYVEANGPVIGQALPLTLEPYGQRVCMAVFGGVLPEQHIRTAIAGWLGVSESNDYRLLEELGGDCAGAIEFFPDGEKPDRCELTRPLSAEVLDRILRELPERPVPDLGDDGHVRMSLAGAQSKLPVVIDANGYSLPGSHGAPSTHIVKPEPARFPGLVMNEAFCMRLARALELRVANVSPVQTLTGLSFLLVERYDRDVTQQPVKRLHQEDICQALGVQPDQKYQSDGGPSFMDVVELVRRASAAPAHDLRGLWDSLVFNVLIGNCDAHGKNYSLLYDGERPMLAPLYDLVATAVYPSLTQRLAMSVGEARQLDDVTLDSWRQCAERASYAPGYVVERVQSIARRALAAASILRDGFLTQSPEAQETIDLIMSGMRERATRWLVS